MFNNYKKAPKNLDEENPRCKLMKSTAAVYRKYELII